MGPPPGTPTPSLRPGLSWATSAHPRLPSPLPILELAACDPNMERLLPHSCSVTFRGHPGRPQDLEVVGVGLRLRGAHSPRAQDLHGCGQGSRACRRRAPAVRGSYSVLFHYHGVHYVWDLVGKASLYLKPRPNLQAPDFGPQKPINTSDTFNTGC